MQVGALGLMQSFRNVDVFRNFAIVSQSFFRVPRFVGKTREGMTSPSREGMKRTDAARGRSASRPMWARDMVRERSATEQPSSDASITTC